MKLSVAIATYNEEKNLDACLASVVLWADEIVLVDGGSHDRTLEIAQKYNARVVKTDNPPIFHINKQKSLDLCHGEWILQLDADEIVTPELTEEVKTVISKKVAVNGYYIARRNNFWGHWMKKGGQYPDYVIRLVRNGKSRFPCKSVHEQIEVDGETGYLSEPLEHYAYRTKKDYWKKADAYTSLTAVEMKKNHVHINPTMWFFYTIMKPLQVFLSIFVLHKGFIDGWYGCIFAYWSAIHYAIAYKKYTALNVNKYEILVA